MDGHVHVGAWDHPAFRGHATTMAESAAILAGAGIGEALVMTTDRRDHEAILGAAEACRLVRCQVALWVCPTTEREDREALDRHAGRYRALKLHPSLSRIAISDRAWDPLLAEARDRAVPVVLHCGRWHAMAGPGLALDLAGRWPSVRFILAHMGGDSPPLGKAAVERVRSDRLDNVWFGTESIREYWSVQRAVDVLGPSRFCFGSDHNLALPASYLPVIQALRLSSEERAAILGDNLRGLLGMAPSG
jgi:predicted TIM-barrel fold metal-dependent hydrolase